MAEHYIGLISGTSLDAIDAALLRFEADTPLLIAALSHPLPETLRQGLLALCRPGDNEIERLGRLDAWLGEVLAEAVQILLERADMGADQINAIGSHGQTIRHVPEGEHPFTLQIGDPNRLAEHTGITTVADLRRRDMAAGGEAAPLVPAFHHAVFRDDRQSRVIVNIGGISNITVLPADPQQAVTGYDTGPGNVLMDGWIHRHRRQDYDVDGQWAATGSVHDTLLAQCLADPYLQLPPPKSTGREHYHLGWLDRQLAAIAAEIAPVDVQTTLCEFTARTIAGAIGETTGAVLDSAVYVCGGGAHNRELMRRLSQALQPLPVATTEALGIAPDWVEASAFAWLARRTVRGQAGNIPSVTGASRPVVLGGVYARGVTSAD